MAAVPSLERGGSLCRVLIRAVDRRIIDVEVELPMSLLPVLGLRNATRISPNLELPVHSQPATQWLAHTSAGDAPMVESLGDWIARDVIW